MLSITPVGAEGNYFLWAVSVKKSQEVFFGDVTTRDEPQTLPEPRKFRN